MTWVRVRDRVRVNHKGRATIRVTIGAMGTHRATITVTIRVRIRAQARVAVRLGLGLGPATAVWCGGSRVGR